MAKIKKLKEVLKPKKELKKLKKKEINPFEPDVEVVEDYVEEPKEELKPEPVLEGLVREEAYELNGKQYFKRFWSDGTTTLDLIE